jgi:hypothetical protein
MQKFRLKRLLKTLFKKGEKGFKYAFFALLLLFSVGYARPQTAVADSLPLQKIDTKVDRLQHIFDAIDIDAVVVSAPRFDAKEFIRMVERDETFYLAFSNLRHVSYKASNEVRCFTRLGRELASYRSRTEQRVDSTDCRTMARFDEKTTGRYYKKQKKSREPRYYTAKMYEKLFFTYGRICHSDVLKEEARERRKKSKLSGIDYHIAELKKLIFSPGKKADIPMIGNKTAIFSKKMSRYYDYKIQQKSYNGMECHVFIIEPKPAYQNRRQERTVIKYLETYFEKLTHQVVARVYHLRYDGIFSFNVKMQIEVSKLGDDFYVPTKIAYDGQWSVPIQDTEKCVFNMQLWDFEQPTAAVKP